MANMDSDNRLYTVIIADVSGSKQLSGRNRYQTQLFMKSAIVQINEQFADLIEAPFTITKGDEFQGLLTDMAAAFEIVLAFEKLTFPVKLRFGVGVGTVFKMGSHLPIEMDGPAFHHANAALNLAKKRKCTYCINTNYDEIDLLPNTIFELMTAIKTRWTERHYRLYWNYQDLGTYREVAALESVTPQAICDTLKNMRANSVRAAENSLLSYFRNCPLNICQSEDEWLEEARLDVG